MYSAAAEAKKWLVKSSETYLGDLIVYFDSLNERLAGLEYSLEHGKPREPYYTSFTDKDWETYVRGMANLARLLMPEVIRRIRLPASNEIGGSAHPVPLIREWCAEAATFRVMPLRFPGVTLIEATDWRPL